MGRGRSAPFRCVEYRESVVDPLEQRAVAAVRAGDASAYDYLVSKYLRRTLSIVWGIVRNGQDAEDLAQEAFVKAYERMDRFREGEPFGPWIYRIATNLALDLARHRARVLHQPPSDDLPAARLQEADLPARSNEIAQRIDAALESLPTQQGLVARLHLVEELEHSEIATITGLSEGTVRSHLSLARKKLRESLRDLWPEEKSDE
jgi:RNA polymerase sigma-70 factor (ECF subfamily)